MSVKLKTTITSTVDPRTLESNHDLTVVVPDGLTEEIAKAILIGGLRSALLELGYKSKKIKKS